jgi:hypothetical protein
MSDRSHNALLLFAVFAAAIVTIVQIRGWPAPTRPESGLVSQIQAASVGVARSTQHRTPEFAQNFRVSMASGPSRQELSSATLEDMARSDDPDLRAEAAAVLAAVTQETFD